MRPFLTARWQTLLMLNWKVDPSTLAPLVPKGTQLDFFEGECWCSVVAFLFLDTRVLGVPILFHRNFAEVNLRFYVTRQAGSELRRGVVFVREYVPRFWIAFIANALYNEKYTATQVSSTLAYVADQEVGDFAWRASGAHHKLAFECAGQWMQMRPGSREQFIAEHYWGYTQQRDGSTLEYRVAHPSWKFKELGSLDTAWGPHACYGALFGQELARPPDCAFVADGSPVSVFYGKRLPAGEL